MYDISFRMNRSASSYFIGIVACFGEKVLLYIVMYGDFSNSGRTIVGDSVVLEQLLAICIAGFRLVVNFVVMILFIFIW